MTDVLGPTQIAEQIDPIKVQGETEVQFETDGSPELKVLLLESEDKSERVSLKNENTLVLPKEANEYIYQIKATWGKSLRSEEHTLNSSHVAISYAVFC